MKSRFRQPSAPTTLDFGLGRDSFIRYLQRRQQERVLEMGRHLAHSIVGCTPQNPCGNPGCVNAERRQQASKAN